MRRIVIMLTLLIASVLAAPANAQRVSFADAPLDGMPKDFVTALTGQGRPGKWVVVEDNTAEGGRALAQLDADSTDYRFPLAIYMPTFPSDVEATIRFKAISGKEDQAVAWSFD